MKLLVITVSLLWELQFDSEKAFELHISHTAAALCYRMVSSKVTIRPRKQKYSNGNKQVYNNKQHLSSEVPSKKLFFVRMRASCCTHNY